MILHNRKSIFVEVPKTGTSSIRMILGSPPVVHMCLWQIKQHMETDWTHYGGFVNKLRKAAYVFVPDEKKKEIGRQQFEEYFKFGFVRNPWDRVVSTYLRREGLQLRDKMSFEEFVKWMKYASSTGVSTMPMTNQLDYFVDPSGHVVADFIGRFERLREDWAEIGKKIGIDQKLGHEKKNTLRDKHYSEYYSNESRDIIARRFAVDIEHFGYEFEDHR